MKQAFCLAFFTIAVSFTLSAHAKQDSVLFARGSNCYHWYEELSFHKTAWSFKTRKTSGKVAQTLVEGLELVMLYQSLAYYKEVVHQYPTSPLLPLAIHNVAQISRQLGETQQAIRYYKKLLASDANDQEYYNRGIMASPYALYKYGACKSLATLYMQQGHYRQAIQYLDSLHKYPFRHFCYNAYAAAAIYKATLYTKAYYALGEVEKALSYAIPEIFNSALASNETLVTLTAKLIKARYTKEYITQEVEKATHSFQKRTFYKEGEAYTHCYLVFMNVAIDFPCVLAKHNRNMKAYIRSAFTHSHFMALINQEPPFPLRPLHHLSATLIHLSTFIRYATNPSSLHRFAMESLPTTTS
ncbi:MAG: tol-pal system YbgF family protein [Thermonemataceae bacterium]